MTVTFTPASGHHPGDPYELALQVANPVPATGLYPYAIEVSGNDGTAFDKTFSAQEAVVVRDSTTNPDPFGAGWGLDGLDQLVPIAGGAGVCAGILWVYGDGSTDFFASNGGGYVTPPDVFGALGKNTDGSYTFTDPHQTKEKFNSQGYLTSVVDAHSLTVTYSYDGSNRLTGVATPDGGQTTLSYSGSYLSQVQEPGSRTVTVGDSGDLTSLSDAAGNSRSFGYDGNHHLSSDQWAPWNDQFGYDGTSDRLVQVSEGLGTTYTLLPQQVLELQTTPLVSPPNNVATLTDPRSNGTIYNLDDWQGVTQEQTADGAVQRWMRDNAEEVLAYTDAKRHVTGYTYDGNGDLATQTNADGGTWQYQYDSTFHNLTQQTSPRGGVTTYALDPNTGDVTSSTDPNTHTTTYTYYQTNNISNGLVQTITDPNSHVSTNTYDSARRLSTVEDALTRVTTYSYDSAGNPLTVIDPNSHTSTTQYDGDNRLTAQSDGEGDTTRTSYDAYGDTTSTTNPRGYITSYSFDQRALRTAVTEAVGTTVQRTTSTAYDAAGNATTVTDPLTHVTTYAYNVVNEQTSATDPLTHVTRTAYDPAGNVTSVTDPLSHTTTFQYDPMNRKTAVTDALNETNRTAYDLDGNKTSVTDPRGDTTRFGFDLAEQQTTVSDALGEVTTTAYDPAGNPTTVTDPLGHVTTSTYDAANQVTQMVDPLGIVTTYAYDLAGNRTSVIDGNGHSSTYGFDAANRRTSASDALGNTIYTYYDRNSNTTAVKDPRGNTTTYSFDPLDRQTAVTNALGQTTTTLYDANDNQTAVSDALARTTTFLYDAANQKTQSTDPLGRLSTMAYDLAGNLTTETDYKGKTTSYAYDAVNRQTKVTNPDGDSTTTTYDPASNVVSVENADQDYTTYTYDPLNRQVAEENADFDTTYTVYDGAGNKSQVIDPEGIPTVYSYDRDNRLSQVVDPKGNTSTMLYDNAGDQTQSIDTLGNVTTFQYDIGNRQTLMIDAKGGQTTMAYDPDGNKTQVIDPTNATTTYMFDAVNRVTSVINADTGRTTVVLDAVGNQTAVTDAQNHTTTYGFDAGHRRTSVTDANNHTTTYLYDNNDNLTTVTDPDNNTTTFVYDPDNRKTQATDPLGKVTTYAYDLAGRQTSMTDALGQKVTDTYDGDGNKVGETWLKAGGGTADVFTFTYDSDGNLTSAANSLGTYTLSHDEDNQLTSETTPSGVTLTYDYDSNGNQVLETDSLGGVLTSVYDPLNRLSSRQFSDGNNNQLRFDESWTARGQLSSLTRYSDVAGTTQVGLSTYSYDPAGNVQTIKHSSGSTSLASYSYAYDPANRLTSESDNGAASIVYGYDPVNQLTSAGTHTYSYDAAGNPTSGGLTPGAGNELKTDGTWTYTYDTNGNESGKTKTGESWSYSYNQVNQLVQAVDTTSSGTTTVTYKYDALGNLAERDVQVNGGAVAITRYVYDASGQVIADLDGANSNALLARYFYDARQTQPIARIQYSGTTGTPAWYLADHLGSVTGLMSKSGSLLATRTYDPFGNITSQTGTTMWDRFGFTGQPLDSVTGEQQNRERWYNAATMQWTTRDPMGFGAGQSDLYEYAGNNPTDYTDPSGLMWANDIASWLPGGVQDYLASSNSDWIRDWSNWGAGYGDKITADWTWHKRRDWGYNDVVEVNSAEYQQGTAFGQSELNAFNNTTDVFSGWSDVLTYRGTELYREGLLGLPRYNNAGYYYSGVTIGTVHQALMGNKWGAVFGSGMLVEGYGDYSLQNPQGPLAVSNPEAAKWIQVAGLTVQAYSGARGLAGPVGYVSRLVPGGGALLTGGGLVGLGYALKNYWEADKTDWTAADHARFWLPLAGGVVGGMSPGARRAFAQGQANGAAARARMLGNCFPTGTPVATLQGLKPIERIGAGEPVWSFDFRTGQWVRCRVGINHSAVYEGQFVTLRFDDGTTLEVTEDHPFWVVAGEGLWVRPALREREGTEDSGLSLPGRWVHSQFLRVGDELYGRECGRLTVMAMQCRYDRKKVYNLSVLGLPYYAVGAQGILVHNTDTFFGRMVGAIKRMFSLGEPTVPAAELPEGTVPTSAARRAQPNQNALELYRNPEFQALVDNEVVDCSRLTNELLEASGGQGGELAINPPPGETRVRFPTKLGIEEGNYHSVYCDREFVFDPRFRDTPIPRAEYEALIRDLNGGNVNINFGARE